jgi:hypothetical protein
MTDQIEEKVISVVASIKRLPRDAVEGEHMQPSLTEFRITDLRARVAEGVAIQWQGQELNSGPLNIELDETASTGNRGVLDYGKRRVQANFQVLLTFPELASMLEMMGVDPQLTHSVRAAICSEGQILDDHSFILSGPCKLADHALLSAEQTTASVLPGT